MKLLDFNSLTMLITQVEEHNQCISEVPVYWTWGSISILHYVEQRNAFNWKIRTNLNLKPAWAWKLVNYERMWQFISFLAELQSNGTHMPFWGRWQWSHKCHLRMAHARLADGSSACPRACNSLVTPGKSSGKNGTGLQRPEKGLLSHGVSRGGAHQCPHAASTGIICTSVSTTLCRFKTNKKISVIWNIDYTHVMRCMVDCLFTAYSKLRFTKFVQNAQNNLQTVK